jgi:hypothetical protein
MCIEHLKLALARARMRRAGTTAPDGQISFAACRIDLRLSSARGKNISVLQKPNHVYIRLVPSHQKGRLAIVTNAGRDAVDAEDASDEGI